MDVGRVIDFDAAKRKVERKRARAAFYKFHYLFDEDAVDCFWSFVGNRAPEDHFKQFFDIIGEETIMKLWIEKRWLLMDRLLVETPQRKITLAYDRLKGFEVKKVVEKEEKEGQGRRWNE